MPAPDGTNSAATNYQFASSQKSPGKGGPVGRPNTAVIPANDKSVASSADTADDEARSKRQ